MPAGIARPAADSARPTPGWRYVPPPRVSNRAGMNRFAWNMRMPDASGFDGMILWAAGMTGPMVSSAPTRCG
jgi:hypothetical protein